MAITIQKLGTESGGKTEAVVRHESSEFLALIDGSPDSLKPLVGKPCLVEMDYARLVSWRELVPFDEDQSGVTPFLEASGPLVVRGKVHQVIASQDGEHVIDVYLRNGPEFLAVSSADIDNHVPEVGVGLEVVLENLCFFPTNT